MSRKRYIIGTLILVLCVSSVGCAALQRKFVRKKKEKERYAPVITTFDYSKELRVDELYKKHYLFWKTWQMELIDNVDAGLKKRTTCYDYTMKNLLEMKGYLKDPKSSELEVVIEEVKTIDPEIREKNLSKNKQYRITKLLERTLRQIEKRFSYSDVKDFLELKR